MPYSRRGTHRASARERAYKFVKYWRVVVRRWPSRHGRYCRAKMGRGRTCAVSCLSSSVTPPCPFLPSLLPLPPAPALRCLGRAIDFPFPFLPQRNATVFGAARSACVAALMRPERLRLSGVRSALVRLAACRGWNDGISMWTVDKWTVDFFFFLNWRHPLLSFFLSFAKVKFLERCGIYYWNNRGFFSNQRFFLR